MSTRQLIAMMAASALIAIVAMLNQPPPIPPENDAAVAIQWIDAGPAIELGGAEPPPYNRAEFGQAWADSAPVELLGRNGCDTRNDILARDLDPDTRRPNTQNCVVETGTLVDPYTGATIEFQRGERTSGEVQIDHVVPLSWAWNHGAWAWSPQRREQFANDPLNLLATAGAVNAAKGDSGPAEWTPAVGLCAYVDRWEAVLVSYGLLVGAPDSRVIAQANEGCPT